MPFSCHTVELLERKTPEFILLLLWPQNLPDLNLVDYCMWSILQEKVYETRITYLNDWGAGGGEGWE